MKRVVMFAGPYHPIPPIKGAAVETWIYEVSKRLIKYHPYIISIGSPFYPKKEFKEGIFFYRINFGRVYKRVFQKFLRWDIYSYFDRIFKYINKIKPDIIHIHNYLEIGKLIKRIKKNFPQTKIILHMHNIKKINFYLEIDACVGVSNFITEYYRNIFKTSCFHTIYNGVDISRFLKSRFAGVKNKFKENVFQKNIFYIGRISPEKGVDKIVKLADLCKDKKDWKFFCVGEISQKGERAKYYKKLLKFIEEKKIKNIEFWDWISPSKIHYVYSLADLVIIPSQFEEPFCMVALEAMASKVPIIAAEKGGMKEYLIHNKNAIVIKDYNNFEKIAKKYLEKMFEDRVFTNKIIKNAFETVKQKFDWQKIAIEVENFYDSLLKEEFR